MIVIFINESLCIIILLKYVNIVFLFLDKWYWCKNFIDVLFLFVF